MNQGQLSLWSSRPGSTRLGQLGPVEINDINTCISVCLSIFSITLNEVHVLIHGTFDIKHFNVRCDLEQVTLPQLNVCIYVYIYVLSRNKKLYRIDVDC